MMRLRTAAVRAHTCPARTRVAFSAAKSTAADVEPNQSDELYSYNTPSLHKVQREDLDGQWDKLGFSIRNINGHVRFTWSNGSWDEGVFVPAPYQLMHINAGALHYGVSVFEGMKAFESKEGKIRLVKPGLNAARMRRGADALLMPPVPEEMFVNAVKEVVRRNREFVPPYGHGASMYIRPLLFASGPMLGLAPLASEYTFFVTAMPAGGYFKAEPRKEGEGQLAQLEPGVKAVVSEEHDRAAPRGTGNVKAAGNYAADLFPVHAAQGNGFNTTLYLDAKEQRYIEEFSVANFIGVTKAGVFVTPRSDTILASTTNQLLMEIARSKGITVEERPVDFEAEMGDFAEVGMCGTAAVVVRVESITRGETTYEFGSFATIASLRATLTGIQHGEIEDSFSFMDDVCDIGEDGVDHPYTPSFVPEMVSAEETSLVRRLGSDGLHGHERHLLEHVVQHAEPGNPDSVLKAMDTFWSDVLGTDAAEKWASRGRNIEQKVREAVVAVNKSAGTAEHRPVRCLELGTYCGYSALLIARNLPEGGTLLSVEKDPLFAAIATKIVEFAGLDKKVKVWMGHLASEICNVEIKLEHQPADFVLCDHSMERYVHDLKLLELRGIIDPTLTWVIADLEIFPGDPKHVDAEGAEQIQEKVRRYISTKDTERFEEVAPASFFANLL